MDIRKIFHYAIQREGKRFFEKNARRLKVPDLPVPRMAYMIEPDIAEFYEKAAKGASGEARKVLQLLAKWGRGHEALFKKMHDKAHERYAGMPWGGKPRYVLRACFQATPKIVAANNTTPWKRLEEQSICPEWRDCVR